MGTAVEAHQLIYSRVEASAFADIPHVNIKTSGYQVVYHSPQIADEVPEIERRVQCFRPKRDATRPPRFQFFRTESGRVVVTQSIGIDADPHITDPNQRSGSFIAHCLVFSAAAFSRVKNNPFMIIFDAYPQDKSKDTGVFIDHPQDMLEMVRQNQETLTIQLQRYRRRNNSQWEQYRPELQKFIRASQSSGFNDTITFIGQDETKVEDLLEMLITMANQPDRLKITFDTLVDSCNPAPGKYFAVGSHRRISNSKFININVDNPTIELDILTPKVTGYSNWLSHSLNVNTLNDTLQQAEFVQELNRSFEAGELLDREPADESEVVAIKQFLDINTELILTRYREVLSDRFSDALVEPLHHAVTADQLRYLEDRDIIGVAAQEAITDVGTLERLGAELYALILETPIKKFSRRDVAAIRQLATESGSLRLRAVAVMYALQRFHLVKFVKSLLNMKTAAETDRDELVAELIEQDALVATMTDLHRFEWGDPLHFLTPASESTVLHFLNDHGNLNLAGWLTVILKVLDVSGGQSLHKLTRMLDNYDSEQLQQIEAAVEKSNGTVHSDFQKALTANLEKDTDT